MKTLNINNNDDDDNDATLVAHHKIVEFEIAVQPIHPYPVPITASMRQATMANTQSSSSTFASSRTTCKLLRNGAEGISRSRKRKSDNDKKEKESDEEYAKTPSSSGNFCLTSTPSNKASTSTVSVTAMEKGEKVSAYYLIYFSYLPFVIQLLLQKSKPTNAKKKRQRAAMDSDDELSSHSSEGEEKNDQEKKEQGETKAPSSSGNFCLTSTPSNKASTSTVAVTAMEDLFQMEHSSQPTNTNEIEAQSSSRTLNKNTPKTQPNMPHEKPRITPMIFEHFFFR